MTFYIKTSMGGGGGTANVDYEMCQTALWTFVKVKAEEHDRQRDFSAFSNQNLMYS